MASKFKQFAAECFESGQMLAYYFTPPITHTVTVPVFGAILGATIAPVLRGVDFVIEKSHEQIVMLPRRKASEAEKSIAEQFGKVSAKAYPYYGGGIELRFTEARVYTVRSDNKADPVPDYHRYDIHYDREQCALDLLGNLAQAAAFDGFEPRPDEPRYIVVRKAGDLHSQFYVATKVKDKFSAPRDSIFATNATYSGVIGHGGIEKSTHYAITPVNEETAFHLRGLGL